MDLKDTIIELSNRYVEEASKAKNLFEDMASMESYMSESYSDRVLIELIQNADDAKSKKIIIKFLEGHLLFANDGKSFNKEDIISISRSGKSEKNRGESIGYRGVGFKSSTSISQEIIIMSNEVLFSFSKSKSQEILGVKNVPTIRIPFLIEFNSIPEGIQKEINELSLIGYETFFIFLDANKTAVVEEIDTVNEDYFLFLNSIISAEFHVEKYKKYERKISDQIISINCCVNKEKNNRYDWRIFKSNDDRTAIAFKLDADKIIIPCSPIEAKYHCFLPTMENCGLAIKMNSDFSTDPSRKHIVMDNNTNISMESLSELLFNSLTPPKNSTSKQDFINILSILNKKINFNKLTEQIVEKLDNKIKDKYKIQNKNDSLVNVNKIYKKPNWLTQAEFATISSQSKVLDDNFPMFVEKFDFDFFGKYSEKEFGDMEIKKILTDSYFVSNVNQDLYCKLLSNLITKLRIDSIITGSKLDLSNLLIKDNGKLTTILEISTLDPEFEEKLSSVLSDLDKEWIQINTNLIFYDKKNKNNDTHNNIIPKVVQTKPRIQKWRTAEKKCVEFENLQGYNSIDVSKQNLGYDVKSIKNDGTVRYIEVKSIQNFGSSFTMTNNEYTAAAKYKDDYFICLVYENDNKISFSYIRNPLENFEPVKQVKQWEWFVDSYTAQEYSYRY